MKNYINNLKSGWADKNNVQKATAVAIGVLALVLTLIVFG